MKEYTPYLTTQLITYIGNKRRLLSGIEAALAQVKKRLGKDKLRCFDVFSGSGVVSRLLKGHSSVVVSNDIENYASVISRCYLANKSEIDEIELSNIVEDFNTRVHRDKFSRGFIEEMYSPKDENHITANDRVFYTRDNAQRLDNYRRMIKELPPSLQDFMLAPLLSEASIHVNTSGVFKGFHKNSYTKLGQFGGSKFSALSRILGRIVLKAPVLSNFECEYQVLQGHANTVAQQVYDIDVAYLDPPYNQHPYGSNYFMLNLLSGYERPSVVSRVSGIPADWRRSGYNVRTESLRLVTDLVRNLDAKFLLVSFNDEGFIPPEDMYRLLESVGSVEVKTVQYNTFRGCRGLKDRSAHVAESLYLVERT